MDHALIARAAAAATLTLSDDAGVECILTGIPLLCTGILSLGAFTFILATRRTDVLITALFASCFFAFIAIIIDLSQILVRGYASTSEGSQLGQVAGLIKGREVFLAFSVGFLYLFYWFFSSRQPTGALSVSSNTGAMASEKVGPLMATQTTNTTRLHCASWERWGYVGIALKWASLVTCFLIVTLQLVWRLTKRHNLYGDLYVASATLETAISIVFVLKLFLNSYLAEPQTRRQVLLGYTAPVLAFVLSAGIGIGNLVVFAFSETSLGRFLRGVEVYILVVYYLIITFRVPSPEAVAPRYQPPTGETYAPPEKFNPASTYAQPVLPFTSITRNATANPSTEAIWQLNRVSHISRISSWVESRRSSRKSLAAPQVPQSPPVRSVLFQQQPPPMPSPSTRSESSGKSFISPPPRPAQSTHSSMNFLSYYGQERLGKAPTFRDDASTIGSDSPIYGLNGIIIPPKKTKPSKLTEVSGGQSGEVTPVRMTRLMQTQADIDRSIDALREQTDLNKPDHDTNEVDRTVQLLKAAQLTPDPTTSTSDISKAPSSPANGSEFSLSVFPEPPAPAIVSPTSLRELSIRPKVSKQSLAKRVPPISVAPIQVDGETRDSMADYGSPLSNGTRYDVTSFIGGFASFPQTAYPPSTALNSSHGVLPSSTMFTGSIFTNAPEQTPSPREILGRRSPTSAGNTASQYVTITRSASRPLGSATMSSSASKPDSPSKDIPAQNLALRTFLTRNETTRSRMTVAPSGPF